MSRILGLPTKYPELGRIRTGMQEEGKKYPTALDVFRFTTKDLATAKAIQSLYGGNLTDWQGQHEVISETDTLECLLPTDPIFAAYELWGSGGNQRRCDGETCVVPIQDPEGGHLEEVPCVCVEQGLAPGDENACSVTVRLKVVLPRIPGFGIWMLTSGSIYAAMELPAQVGLIDSVRRNQNINIPCELVLEPRTEKRTYEKFTRNYHVPVLRVRESVERLLAAVRPGGDQRSLAPARMAPAPGPLAPGDTPGLPPGPPRTAPVVEAGQPGAALEGMIDLTTKKAYTLAQLQKLCVDASLSSQGKPDDLIRRLKINGHEI